tara:strand:- start:6292 stop:7215 length:924 start_codon:yes stop_codon:yes gene_type:complete
MGTKISAPPPPEPRSYAEEYGKTLDAQIKYAPALYESEAEYRPQYLELDLAALRDSLQGRGGQEGLLDIYRGVQPRMSQMEADANRAGRTADLSDVEEYGSRATDALLSADPYKKRISDALAQQAAEDLEAGATLDPSLRREAQQAYRQAATARGMAYSPSSAAEEAYFTGLRAEQLRRNRQQSAMNILGQRQALTGDPFMQILGRPGQTFGAVPGTVGAGAGLMSSGGPQLFNPESQYAGNLYGQNYAGALQNQQLQARAAMQSGMNKANLFGSVVGGLGGLGGGLLSGMGRASSMGRNFWTGKAA